MLLNILKKRNIKALSVMLACACALSACGQVSPAASGESASNESASLQTLAEDDVPTAVLNASGLRDNTPVCYVPVASGVQVYSNALAAIDASNVSQGYIMVNYTGSNPKVKLQITGSNGVTFMAAMKHFHYQPEAVLIR